ncbi:hypothetical protein LEP1GSC172_2573 [Leptospira noguchii]|uniref:Uncharacterized protein n=2 Tax=Leptospira noguchii TaxID=28182 RepID=T0GU09_9LEPT|nr:hypothetical protein LEP1GSC172_2573 [Leptospira noguchii]EQA72417.1 hypothetical protein LEP1GSC059_0761 [Leptospira noguchii serovar Panama str. CZ214]
MSCGAGDIYPTLPIVKQLVMNIKITTTLTILLIFFPLRFFD